MYNCIYVQDLWQLYNFVKVFNNSYKRYPWCKRCCCYYEITVI